ncbi:MAG TPA: xanthine dehydrogenase family protein subunit M [Gemmatimonadales bacterium]
MIPASFEYARARTLAQALKAVASDDTKLVAGGQTMIPLLRFRLAAPKRLVDISGIAQLQGIKRTPAGLRIGAGSTYRELLDSPLVGSDAPLIAEVAQHVGDRQVRNLGTLGGGLVHADPASDMPAVMLALDVTFNLLSQTGKRSVAAREFFTSAFTTAMQPDELLVDLVVPKLPKGAGSAYATFEQPASGYALTAAAAVVAKSKGTITHAALAFTGLADHAFRVEAAASLIGTPGDAGAVAAVADHAADGVEPNDDIHASAAYRRHLAGVAARRALTQAIERAR